MCPAAHSHICCCMSEQQMSPAECPSSAPCPACLVVSCSALLPSRSCQVPRFPSHPPILPPHPTPAPPPPNITPPPTPDARGGDLLASLSAACCSSCCSRCVYLPCPLLTRFLFPLSPQYGSHSIVLSPSRFPDRLSAALRLHPAPAASCHRKKKNL